MEEIRTLRTEELDASMDLSCFAFQYELNEQERADRKAFTKPEITWGYFIDQKLAAKMTIHPIQTYINGRTTAVGGVASVATWPEYRRKGMVAQLLSKGLQAMKDDGRTISFLHPFSIPFYRKFGWELYTDYVEYELTSSHLPAIEKSSGSVERVERDWTLLHGIYTDYALQYNGMLVRDEAWWKYMVFRQKKGQAVIYRNQEGQARGYMIYEVKNRTLTAGEFVWLDMDAWYGLWKFIANHDSMFETITVKAPSEDPLPYLLHNPTVKRETVPYFMARIVDVAGYLEQALFEAGTWEDLQFRLRLEDGHADWNNGWFEIAIRSDGTAQARKLDLDPLELDNQANDAGTVHCDIQTLSALLIGYKRPADLHRYGRLQANVRTVEALERVIPKTRTYLSDYF